MARLCQLFLHDGVPVVSRMGNSLKSRHRESSLFCRGMTIFIHSSMLILMMFLTISVLLAFLVNSRPKEDFSSEPHIQLI
jgi:hypothetical protein